MGDRGDILRRTRLTAVFLAGLGVGSFRYWWDYCRHWLYWWRYGPGSKNSRRHGYFHPRRPPGPQNGGSPAAKPLSPRAPDALTDPFGALWWLLRRTVQIERECWKVIRGRYRT